MNTIRLQSDGAIIDDCKPVETDPLRFLSYKVELTEDFTLRSFFRIFTRYPLLVKLNTFFPSYLEQYRACPESNCVGAGFDFLEFGKTVEMIGYPGEPSLEIYHSLRGVCGTEVDEIKSSRLERLLDLPLKLGKLKHVVFGDRMEDFEFDTVFTLFEFVDGIAWELSFHGTPDACDLGLAQK